MTGRDCGCRGRRLAMRGAAARAVALVLLFASLAGARGSPGPDGSSTEATVARAPPELERYAGTYLYAGTDAERAAIEAAIDHATRGMPGRAIAQGELSRRSEVRPSYTIRLDGRGNLAIETPGFPPEVFPLDGSQVPFRNKYGDVLRARARFVEGALVQDSTTSDGGGTTRFELQPDGKTLLVTRISWSPKLPGTVRFRLTYVRGS